MEAVGLGVGDLVGARVGEGVDVGVFAAGFLLRPTLFTMYELLNRALTGIEPIDLWAFTAECTQQTTPNNSNRTFFEFMVPYSNLVELECFL